MDQNNIDRGFKMLSVWRDAMYIKKYLLIVILLCFPIIAYSQSSSDALMHALYIKSGLEKQIHQLPLVIQAGFDQAAMEDDRIKKMPGNIILGIRGLIKESFATESLKNTILQEIRNKLNNLNINNVIKWLDSPIGKKCTQLEEAASTPKAFSEVQQFAAQIQKSPPPSYRLRLIQKMDSTVKATETNVEITMNTQLAVTAAIIATLPLEQQIPFSEINNYKGYDIK